MRFGWDEAKNQENRRKHGLDFVSAFLRSTTDGTPPPVTGEDHLKVLKVIEAAYESSATGRRIDL